MGHVILLVDDEHHVTKALKRALWKEPYEILSASSAGEALAILACESVDVVVSDEKMPGMCGSEFLGVVCREYPGTVRIILTGQANLDTAIRAINEGQVYRFLLKPCNEIDLAITIRQALEQRELRAETQRLAQTIKRQSELLHDLESKHPGIADVKRGEDGAIVLDEEDCIPGILTGRVGTDLKGSERTQESTEEE